MEERGLVLVVEDEQPVRVVLGRALRLMGYQVRECAGPAEALLAFDEVGPAVRLLLSDQVMPEMTGTELALKLRERRPGLPVILCSGETLAPFDSRPGGFALLPKPFDLDELAEMVRKTLAPAVR